MNYKNYLKPHEGRHKKWKDMQNFNFIADL